MTSGHAKPPLHTRFSKGASGNPKGRKPGSYNLATKLHLELEKKMGVTIKGKKTLRRKSDVIIGQLVNKAAGGDIRSTVLILQAAEKHEALTRAEQAGLTANVTLADADRQVVADFLSRAAKAAPADE